LHITGELIYEAHIKPGWLLAPYFQYVFRPSAAFRIRMNQAVCRGSATASLSAVTTTLSF
jgi:porin